MSLPLVAGARAEEMAPVAVAVTTWQGDPRLVFRWKREVGFEIAEDGADWRIRFDRKAAIEGKRLLKEAKSFKPRIIEEPEGVVVALRLPDGKRLRAVRSGASVVVDIVPGP